MTGVRRTLAAAALATAAGCAADEAPSQARSVEDLRACVRDEVNEGRGTAHPSVLGELAAAHCADEIFRFVRAEQGGGEPDRVRERARQLETELRAYGLRYALGLEG
jgi:hypothetical protein